MIRLKVRENAPIRLKISPAVTVAVGGKFYEGAYEVTPQVEAQTLPTKQKTMQEDLTVKSIPYFEMANQNGTTVYIGSEV